MLTGVFIWVAHAGIRGPGKYSGVVEFDRWDTCFLLSGPYITYISGSVKEGLRPYKGMSMQIDATNVFQPLNPGDALIRKYKIIGLAPDTQKKWATLDGMELIARSDFGTQGTPAFLMEIRNSGSKAVEVNSGEVGPALLGPVLESPFRVSDGGSMAVITRSDLVNHGSWQSTVDGVTHSYSYTVDAKTQPPERFELNPGQPVKVRITFAVPPGKYQFLFGYGGGVHEEKSLASNAISFDLSDTGVATLAKIGTKRSTVIRSFKRTGATLRWPIGLGLEQQHPPPSPACTRSLSIFHASGPPVEETSPTVCRKRFALGRYSVASGQFVGLPIWLDAFRL